MVGLEYSHIWCDVSFRRREQRLLKIVGQPARCLTAAMLKA